MYFTDRGIEELEERRGTEQIAVSWLAERLRDFVDDHPDAEAAVDSLASWLARLDDDDDDGFGDDSDDSVTGSDSGSSEVSG